MASERILLLSLSLSPVSVSYSRSTFTCWQIVTHEFIIERISVVTKATISSQCADIRPSDGDGFNLLIRCDGYGYIGSQWQCHGCSHAEQRKDFWSNLEQPPPRGNPVPRAKPRKSALNSCHMMFSSSRKLVVVVIVVVVLLLLLHTPLSPFPFPLESCSLSWSSTGRAETGTAPALPHTFAVHYRLLRPH